MTYEQALAYLTEHGQEHLLRYYDQLTPEQQAHLLEQIEGLQLERPQFQNRDAAAQSVAALRPWVRRRWNRSLKIRRIPEDRSPGDPEAKVGAVLLAGGQGSRLGFDHPKGMYNMGKTRDLYIFSV
ncbi:MAG: hypothetical protein ACLUOF_06585 [Ruminococcus sp.]